jgi:hypothetical protein
MNDGKESDFDRLAMLGATVTERTCLMKGDSLNG